MDTKWLALIALGASTALAELPEAPSHAVTTSERSTSLRMARKPLLGREAKAMIAADGLLRIADGITTYTFLSDPCRCFREIDPIAPKSANMPAIVGFQVAAFLAVEGGAYWMDRLGHHRIARFARIIDVASEGIAVGNNIHALTEARK